MKKQADEILKAVSEVYEIFKQPEDEALAALKRMIFTRKLELILGLEKNQGVSVRELKEGLLLLVHSSAHLHCKKTAANAVEIEIHPYNKES